MNVNANIITNTPAIHIFNRAIVTVLLRSVLVFGTERIASPVAEEDDTGF